MQLTQRSIQIGVFVIAVAGSLFATIGQLLTEGLTVVAAGPAVGVVIGSVLLVAFVRGWQPARYGLILLLIFGMGLGVPASTLATQAGLIILLCPVAAMTLAGPGWVIASAALVYILVLGRLGLESFYGNFQMISAYGFVVLGMLLARHALDVARNAADANAQVASEARLRAETQAEELAGKTSALEQQNSKQQRLLDLVAVLETPAIVLAEGVLLAPLIGALDDERAARLTERLLRAVADRRARLVILDIAGVPLIDTAAAQALAQTAQAVRLLGSQVVITGITAQVALTLTDLGVLLGDVATARSPQEALERSFEF
ncbi:MAG: STAS domain-containing protein [Roseiflexaceae bacterium]